jgi:pyruvate/2-oxoglutarate/acetoin dehydrogenase E1 component
VDTASEDARSIPGSSAEIYDNVRSNLSDLFKAQPLALGVIGIAIGAGMAAALPATEIEADYLGETSDAVRKKAAQFAAEQTDRATTVAGNVVEAVKKGSSHAGPYA